VDARKLLRSPAQSSLKAEAQQAETLHLRIQMQPVFCYLQELVPPGTHANIIREVNPAHRTGGVGQELGRPGNVNPLGAAPDVQQIVRPNDLFLGIGEQGEGKTSFFRQAEVDLHWVSADRRHPNAPLAELTQLVLEAP